MVRMVYRGEKTERAIRQAHEEAVFFGDLAGLLKKLNSDLPKDKEASDFLRQITPSFERIYASLLVDHQLIKEAELLAEAYQRFVEKYRL